MNYRRIGRWAAAGLGVAAAGAGLWWLKERRTERPEHETLLAEGDYEIRRYPAALTAETVQTGTRDRAMGSGFGVLADYLYGQEQGRPAIAMTVPVVTGEEAPGRWRTRFFLPRGLARGDLPGAGAGVEIGSLALREIAVLKVAGKVDDAVLAEKRAALMAWVAAQGRGAERVDYAFYNSPFLPGPLRHNEVWVLLR